MKRKLQQKRIKKWTQDEISKIIDYITEYGNLEKPTARVYYETFLQVSPIDATWDLIKWKVRYLKTLFAKAEQWTSSPEAKILSADRFVERLQKICPNYYRLHKIFGEKQAQIVEILDSNDSFPDCYNDEFEETNEMTVDVKAFADYNTFESFYPDETVEIINIENIENKLCPEVEITQMSTNSTPILANVLNEQLIAETAPSTTDKENEQMSAKKLKKESLRHSLSALSQTQKSRNEMQRLRLKFEEYKFVQEFQFVKQKFEAEMELKRQELELKKMEIESNEKLRLMEMEKSERLTKYELNLKYNCQNNSLHTH